MRLADADDNNFTDHIARRNKGGRPYCASVARAAEAVTERWTGSPGRATTAPSVT